MGGSVNPGGPLVSLVLLQQYIWVCVSLFFFFFCGAPLATLATTNSQLSGLVLLGLQMRNKEQQVGFGASLTGRTDPVVWLTLLYNPRQERKKRKTISLPECFLSTFTHWALNGSC